MKKKYVVALDQGTTSSRAVLIDETGALCSVAQREFPQIYPNPGWVEHDPYDILNTLIGSFGELVAMNGLTAEDIDSIGITNQRETTLVWNRKTGKPVYNAIVWQCRRSAELIDELCSDAQISEYITKTTGLIPDAYFSASKIKWILDNVEGARAAADAGELAFGTVDSWIIWTLTNGQVHATDVTNASRTMLFDIHKACWDEKLLELFGIPKSMLPSVQPSSSLFGKTNHPGLPVGVPICGVAGDQQAALFGQCCFERGEAKNTYGTGCFLLMNTGHDACESHNGLVTTVAASAPGAPTIEYALEGSVFVGGALIQWLRDELGIINTAEETETLANQVEDTAGVVIVPAFTGLGAPYWDAQARGAILGLTRGAGRAHIARAALEALAYQVADLVRAMEDDANTKMKALNVDGGACANNFLMQFQSDILDRTLRRPQNREATALGAAYLAGLSSGYWKNTEQLRALRNMDTVFTPNMEENVREEKCAAWAAAVTRVRTQ